MARVTCLSLLLIGGIPAASVHAQAVRPLAAEPSALEPVADPEARLERWFAAQRDDVRVARALAGPTSLAAGALMVAAGIYGGADGVYDQDPNLAWLQITVGAVGIAQGIVWLLIDPDAEVRYRRWRAARAGGAPLSERELHRFEGELRATPTLAQAQRALVRWSGIGLLFGGIVTAGALATEDLPDRHVAVGWTTTGIYTALGAVLLVTSLVASGDDAFDRYERGLAPRARLRVAPFASAQGGGLALGATW